MAAQARINGRLPVLTWKHRNSSFLCHGAGLLPSKSLNELIPAKESDKKLINAIIQNCCNFEGLITPRGASSGHVRTRSLEGRKIKKKRNKSKQIMDTEEIVQVAEFYIIEITSNQSTTESTKKINEKVDQEPNLEITWARDIFVIESLQELKESFRKLQKLCLSPYNNAIEDHWGTYFDGTNWLKQIRTLMQASHRIVELMGLGSSILLSYFENEFDRSCQISSLAQLWMDPYYRTLNGFIILIEKEWISFGHPFKKRCGYLSKDDSFDSSPVFIQFLDCVWQTLNQFPSHFEFNNKLLIELSSSIYSGIYGTFIFNNDFERKNYSARSTTESFWTHVLSDTTFKNPLYVSGLEATIVPSYNPRALSLWTSYFLRWYPDLELVSLPRISSDNCGKDILSSMISENLSSKNFNQLNSQTQVDAAEFATKLKRLKDLEKELKKTIDSEKEKLSFLKLGLSISTANEKMLLQKQSTMISNDAMGIRPNLSSTNVRKSRSKRLRTRKSTPSKGNLFDSSRSVPLKTAEVERTFTTPENQDV